MKQMSKRLLVTLCAVSLLTAAGLSSCGGDSTNNGDTSGAASAEPTEIHIFNRLNPEVAVENNPLIAEIEKELNLKIEYEAPPINNYNEKLQITMASGELPDIIYNWGAADANYEQWAGDGLLAELDDKIPNYPNIVSNVPEEMMTAMRSTTTGKIHAIAKPNMVNYWGILINDDWLEAVGMEAPTTLDEFKEVAHAFTYNDPDGNGKDDTYGISTAVTGNAIDIPFLKNAFGLNDVKGADGQYGSFYLRPEYVDYLEYLRELYLDGSMDPEFFTNAYMVDQEKLRSKTVGAISSFQTGVHQQLKYMADADVLDTFTSLPPLENINTGKPMVYTSPAIWGSWMISADADVDKCLELIDYANSEEGFVLMNLGVEGTDYNSYDFANRSVDRTAEQTQTLATYSSSYFSFAFAKDGLPAIYENVDSPERLEKFNKDFDVVKEVTEIVNVPNVKTPLVNSFDADNPDLVKQRSEMETKFVVGEIDRAAFEDFIQNTYAPAAADMNAEYVAFLEDYYANAGAAE